MLNITSERYKNQIASAIVTRKFVFLLNIFDQFMTLINKQRPLHESALSYFLLLAESELNWPSDFFVVRKSNGYTLKPANLNQRYIL